MCYPHLTVLPVKCEKRGTTKHAALLRSQLNNYLYKD